jgi:hypothetical protein
MKKTFLLVSILLVVSLLVACGSSTSADTTDTTDTTTDSTSTGISTETTLLIGTLKLDGTEQEVDAEQAAELLPLWQLYQSLSTSDTAAQEEIDTVVNSIEKAMSADQLETIDAMDLNPQDMFTIMQNLGLAPAPQVDASGTPMPNMMPQDFSGGDRPQFNPGDGGPPAGFSGGQPPEGFTGRQQGQGGGAGGEGFVFGEGGDGQTLSPDALATAQASGAPMRARQMRISSVMLNAIIEYLQAKAEP